MSYKAAQDRKKEYESKEYMGTRDLRLKKLKVKLREHVRRFHYHPALSKGWLKMADSISQVAEVSFMELSVPFESDNKVTKMLGRKETGTLWDQEDDQIAIKILLEEGKINLCMRLLNEYKAKYKDVDRSAAIQKILDENEASDEETIYEEDVEELLDQFEKGSGLILHLALQHEEVLQILDCTVLVAHIAMILKEAEARAGLFESTRAHKFTHAFLGVDKLQESLVFCYLASLAHHLEKLDEEKIVNLLTDHNIVPMATLHMHDHYNWYADDVVAAYFVFMHSVMDSETFMLDKTALLPTKKIWSMCLTLNDDVLPGVLEETKLLKKDVRAFVSECKRFKFESEREG